MVDKTNVDYYRQRRAWRMRPLKRRSGAARRSWRKIAAIASKKYRIEQEHESNITTALLLRDERRRRDAKG